MSINIPLDVSRIATSIAVTVDLGKLGPRQQTSLKKAIKTGVVTGRHSLPSRIAMGVLNTNDMPYVVIDHNRVIWNNMKEDEDHFFGLVNALLATMELDDVRGDSRDREYKQKKINGLRKLVTEKSADSYEYMGHRSLNARILGRAKFKRTMPADFVLPKIVTYELLNGGELP